MKLLLALALLFPQEGPFTDVLSPGTQYDPDIPTLVQVAGHDFHEEVTPPGQVLAYMEALAAAAPDRTHLIRYATSWEGRELVGLVIGAPERMARLDEVAADLRRLADPRGLSQADVDALIADLPVVTALLHGVHGNEISSSGAAMAEAYHLLAATNDPRADEILRESLVLIDPMQNPDGRARFVFQTRMGRAMEPDSDPLSAEHDEPWPGGRVNHYLFDLNRDWFLQSQPESQGRVAMALAYMPHVMVDLHEMGGNSTYYFPPPAVPGNPWTTDAQNASLDMFGRANADAFDGRGFAYFIREVFDSFYPGYGASWPLSQGAIGQTFEQASARGLVLRRNDGTDLTYGDGVLHHFTAAITTAHTAAQNREKLLREFVDFRRGAVALGQSGAREYLLHSPHDPGLAARLARKLAGNGIEVLRADEPVSVAGRTLPAQTTYIVPLAQPAGRLVRNLLDPHTPMAEDFVQLQVERRAARLRDQIYDVTAWSMPLLWDVEMHVADQPTGAAASPVMAEEAPVGALTLPPARVGYLLPWGSTTAAAVAEAVRAGLLIRTVGGAFTLGGREYGIGTALVRNADNGGDLAAVLGSIVARHGAEAVPVNSAYVASGTSLGSNDTRAIREPRVLLVYDRPGSTYSTGWARYVLERRYGQRVTAVRASSLGRAKLADYDVIVLPSGDYGSAINAGLVGRLRDWMQNGGTMITMAESTGWATHEDVGLLATTAELRGGASAANDDPEERGRSSAQAPEQPIDYLEAIAPEQEPPEQTPGAILNVRLDMDHWLSAGTDGQVGALVEGTRIFSPITLDNGQNVGVYESEDSLRASGIVWDEASPQLANKAFLIHQPVGRGRLVAFAEDPNYRAYAEATQLLFINAVLLGSAR
jgi:hypothetical protein